FHAPEAGIGAGVLARHGKVWYTCIPDLYLLEEGPGGKAARTKSLSTGYGVHVAFLGHDLHGLRFGPDGRLYFSVGDRGFNVPTPEARNLECRAPGAGLRCTPDGSGLEGVPLAWRTRQELGSASTATRFPVATTAAGGARPRWSTSSR